MCRSCPGQQGALEAFGTLGLFCGRSQILTWGPRINLALQPPQQKIVGLAVVLRVVFGGRRVLPPCRRPDHGFDPIARRVALFVTFGLWRLVRSNNLFDQRIS